VLRPAGGVCVAAGLDFSSSGAESVWPAVFPKVSSGFCSSCNDHRLFSIMVLNQSTKLLKDRKMEWFVQYKIKKILILTAGSEVGRLSGVERLVAFSSWMSSEASSVPPFVCLAGSDSGLLPSVEMC